MGRRLLSMRNMTNKQPPQEPLAPHSLRNAEAHHTHRAAFCACAGTIPPSYQRSNTAKADLKEGILASTAVSGEAKLPHKTDQNNLCVSLHHGSQKKNPSSYRKIQSYEMGPPETGLSSKTRCPWDCGVGLPLHGKSSWSAAEMNTEASTMALAFSSSLFIFSG